MLKIGYLKLKNPIAIITSNGDPSQLKDFGSAGLLMLHFDLSEVSVSEIKKRIEEANATSALGFSLTGWNRDDLIEAAELAAVGGYLLEMDCSQCSGLDQMMDLGREVKNRGAALSAKIKPEMIEDWREAVQKLKGAGADLIHLDLLDLGVSGSKVVKRFANAGGPKIMAKCQVADFEEAKLIFSMGADVISLNDRTDPEFAAWLSEVFKRVEDLIGWYNAPKHICSGGDLRGLAFCCLPVKNCPIQRVLQKMGVSPQEFAEKKLELARGTPLEYGDGTCFGSLVWCCKITKPCFMRDAVLERIGLSPKDYMKLKKKLAEDLLKP